MGILNGTGSIIDDWLELSPRGKPPYYQHKISANELFSRKEAIADTADCLSQCYQKIHHNWYVANERGNSKPSRQNWRWKQHLELSSKNQSPELILERKIVSQGGDNWSNQMPVASGVVGSSSDKRAAVDLVHKNGGNEFKFIELKVESNTPLFAAIEILFYGLLFIWSKNNMHELDYDIEEQPVLAASKLELCVLAPPQYYKKYDSENLIQALNRGLIEFEYSRDLDVTFYFENL